MKLCERFTARNIDIEPSYDVVIFTGNYADVCANGVENVCITQSMLISMRIRKARRPSAVAVVDERDGEQQCHRIINRIKGQYSDDGECMNDGSGFS